MTINTNNILNNIQMNLRNISNLTQTESNNPADKILHDSISSDIDSTKANLMAYNDAIGYMQVADGVLQGIVKQTETLQTLNVALHNDALNSDQKEMIHHQMQEIKKGITQTLTNTTYNGINVFNHTFRLGDESVSLEVNSNSLNIDDEKSIENFHKFLHNTLSDIAAFTLKATENTKVLTSKIVNESYSKSQFEPDIAKNIIDLNTNELKLQASILASVHNSDLLAKQMQTLLG